MTGQGPPEQGGPWPVIGACYSPTRSMSMVYWNVFPFLFFSV